MNRYYISPTCTSINSALIMSWRKNPHHYFLGAENKGFLHDMTTRKKKLHKLRRNCSSLGGNPHQKVRFLGAMRVLKNTAINGGLTRSLSLWISFHF